MFRTLALLALLLSAHLSPGGSQTGPEPQLTAEGTSPPIGG